MSESREQSPGPENHANETETEHSDPPATENLPRARAESSMSVTPGQLMSMVQECVSRYQQAKAPPAPAPEPAEPEYNFKSEGLAKMYAASGKIRKMAQSALDTMNDPHVNPATIEKILGEIRDAAAYRQKITKMGDKFGWATVAEYEGSQSLGDNAEDDQRIEQAAARAEKKRKAQPFRQFQEKRARVPNDMPGPSGMQAQPQFFRAPEVAQPPAFYVPQAAPMPVAVPAPQWYSGAGFWPRHGTQNPAGGQSQGQQAPKPGSFCYTCGSPEHFARACPKKGQVPIPVPFPQAAIAAPPAGFKADNGAVLTDGTKINMQSNLPSALHWVIDEVDKMLAESKAPSTVTCYERNFQKFRTWCKFNKLCPLPARAETVLAYMISAKIDSDGKIRQFLSAVAWFHSVNNFDSPTKSSCVKLLHEAIARKSAKPPQKKTPVAFSDLKRIYQLFGDLNKCSIPTLRTISLIAVGFFGFFRGSELIALQMRDLKFFPTHLEVTVRKGKTDQLCRGESLTVARENSRFCPVKTLELYISKLCGKITEKNQCYPLFPHLKKSRVGYFPNFSRSISYNHALTIVKDTFSRIGFNKSDIGLHSLRSGGATSAANADVPDRLIKKHGRWKSDHVKDEYIHENLQAKIKLSLALHSSQAGRG